MKFFYKVTAVCLIGALACGCGGSSGGGEGGPEGMGDMAAMQTGMVTSVYAENPSTSTIKNQYTYSATIQPNEEVTVTSTTSGKVAAVYYDVGDYVSAGSVLFQMDTESLQLAVQSAQASLASAQTSLKQVNGGSTQSSITSAKNSITSAETSVETAKANLNTAKTNLDKAQSDYDIYSQLYEAGGISADSLTTYQNALTTAQDNYTNAELSLKSAEDALSLAQSTYDILVNQTISDNEETAQNAVNTAQIALESAQKNLRDATVTSPISGTVLECNVTAGATLSSSSPFVIIDQSTVNVEVNASEQIISVLTVGSEAEITVSTLGTDTFTGTVTEIAPGANSDGTYTVKINIPNPDSKLKSGMSAKVAFNKEISEDALVLPRDSVFNDDEEYYVFVVNGQGTGSETAERRVVEVGVDGGTEIEVTSGISADELVVTKGQTYLVDGSAINAVQINGVVVEDDDNSIGDAAVENEEDPAK
ncbi:MAG: efflux RND transporter periplasmic adaptor subunit [Clostridiales bacterium]|nr:efflux RND transporter periplasmic adaptor subunit [Clostridiales bacterium]